MKRFLLNQETLSIFIRRNADAPEPVLESQQQYSLVCKSPETFNTITIKYNIESNKPRNQTVIC